MSEIEKKPVKSGNKATPVKKASQPKKKKKAKIHVGYEAARILALAVFLACIGLVGDKIYAYIHDDEVEHAFFQDNHMSIGATPEKLEVTIPPYPEATPARITYPQIITQEEINKFEKYDNFVFWLYIDGTNISNYVVQGKDNSFYLRKDIDKKQNGAGSLFMDFRNDPDNLSRHIIVYGHNQKNGKMFSDLRNFGEKDFFDSHKYIYTYAGDGVKVWRVFSAYETDTNDYYIETWFADDSEYFDFIRDFQQKSVAETDVVLKSTDVVMTLSTCHKYTNPKGRFVVHAVLVGEAPLA